MELYVEKEFLDNFCIEFDEKNPTSGQKILATIFEEYGEVEWFIDTEINTPEDFEALELSYYFFAKRSDYKAPNGVSSLKEELFSKSTFHQTLVLSATEQDWFKEAEAKGGLCFSYDNYEKRLSEIINSCHYKIDLSETFRSWEAFNSLKHIPFNEIVLNDNYVLNDNKQQPMDKNIIGLLKNLLEQKREQEVRVKIFTKDLNPKPPGTDQQIKEAVEIRYRKLNSGLANFKKKVQIINNDLQRDYYELHDRVLITNFFSIDSGKGFNLIPGKQSNSQIVVETIFDKYTYKRIKNHKKIYDDYLKRLNHRKTMKFSVYPNYES